MSKNKYYYDEWAKSLQKRMMEFYRNPNCCQEYLKIAIPKDEVFTKSVVNGLISSNCTYRK